jgi:hypothetical protein
LAKASYTNVGENQAVGCVPNLPKASTMLAD